MIRERDISRIHVVWGRLSMHYKRWLKAIRFYFYVVLCYYLAVAVGLEDKELHLGEDLVQYAANDNSLFFKEIEDYDRNIQVASHVSRGYACLSVHLGKPAPINFSRCNYHEITV